MPRHPPPDNRGDRRPVIPPPREPREYVDRRPGTLIYQPLNCIYFLFSLAHLFIYSVYPLLFSAAKRWRRYRFLYRQVRNQPIPTRPDDFPIQRVFYIYIYIFVGRQLYVFPRIFGDIFRLQKLWVFAVFNATTARGEKKLLYRHRPTLQIEI